MSNSNGDTCFLCRFQAKISNRVGVTMNNFIFVMLSKENCQIFLKFKKVQILPERQFVNMSTLFFNFIIVKLFFLINDQKIKLYFRSVNFPVYIHQQSLRTASFHSLQDMQNSYRLSHVFFLHKISKRFDFLNQFIRQHRFQPCFWLKANLYILYKA